MKKRPNYFSYTKAIIGTIVVAFLFFVLGVLLYFWLDKNHQSDKNEIVVIYSAVVGGLCTLFGVILTIIFTVSDRAKDFKYSHMPQFYIPNQFDIAKANRVFVINSKLIGEEIPNCIFYFQNTDKVEFIINSVLCKGELLACNPHFINKNELFCVGFVFKDAINSLVLNTEGLDGVKYGCKVDLNKRCVIIEEDKK